MDKFKHLDDTTFPNLATVDVYSYENTYDYTRWDIDTEIRILDVPWDGTENAIAWDTEADRDRWIDEHTAEIYTLDTEQYLQPDGSIKLPIPFNVACLYNYLAIKYPTAPVQYADNTRIDRFFYFIANTKQLAPSTTECTLRLDAWTTYQNRIDIPYMMLERGHAPMAKINASEYIKDPINNSEGILAPDVNFEGSPSIMGGWIAAKKYLNVGEWIANDRDVYIVIAMSGQAAAEWGNVETDTMHVPGVIVPTFFGGLGYDYIAIKESDFSQFYRNVLEYIPQLPQTIAGIFLISRKLLDFKESFSLGGVEVHFIDTSPHKYTALQLDLNMFDIDPKYNEIAKLYTYPYSMLELTDENGNTSQIPIEQTNGKIDIVASLNLLHPFLGLDVMPINIGGKQQSTEFLLTRAREFIHGGNWYDNIYSWSIPTYAIFQDQQSASKYNRYFQNKQRETERDNALASAKATATTSRDNSARSINAGYWDSEDAANAAYDNATSNRNLTEYTAVKNIENNTAQFQLAAEANATNTAGTLAAQGLAQYLAAENSGISIATTAANGALSAGVTGLMAGGPTAAAAGALAGATFSGVSQMATQSNNASYMDAIGRNQVYVFNALYGGMLGYTAEADAGYYFNNYGGASSSSVVGRTTTQTNLLNRNVANATENANQAEATTSRASVIGGTGSILLQNGTIGSGTTYYGTAKRDQETGHSNNTATYNTGIANADRAADTATKAIDRGNRAQWTLAPDQIGSIANTGTAATRPIGLFFNIVKQSDTAIAQAGDQMLRYGYMLHASWTIDKWQLMKYYTYWKAEDLWIKIGGEASAPKRDASETIREMFLNGITIWSDPENIGYVSIYDNVEA